LQIHLLNFFKPTHKTKSKMLLIRKLRDEKKISGADLAKASGLSLTQLYNIERGTSSPKTTTLEAIALALDVPLASLIDNNQKDLLPIQDIGEVSALRREVAFLRSQLDKTNEHLSRAMQMLSGKLPRNVLGRILGDLAPNSALRFTV
jgi:transcriptional regulator with XRE-family HTH domain